MTRALVLWSEARSPNLGVRALAEGTAALLRRVDPACVVDFQDYGRGPAPANIGIPKTLLRESVDGRRGLKKFVRSYDIVIDTGAGDSFADIYGVQRLFMMWSMARFVRNCRVPLVLGPQTIGPFTTRRGKMLGSSVLKMADRVMARDEVSADYAQQLGRAPDVLTTDVVFALDRPEPTRRYDVLLNVSGLLWNPGPHVDASAYRTVIEKLLAGLAERGRTVTLLAHVLDAPVADNDVPTIRALAAEKNLDLVVPESLDDVRRAVAGAQLVIGSRMHACLNALSVGTPAVPLAYSRKFGPLLKGLGWPHSVDLRSDPDPAGAVLTAIEDQATLTELAEQARERADRTLQSAQAALAQLI